MLSGQPVVHDRHLVKEIFHNMKRNNVHRNAFEIPSNLTIVLCRNRGSLAHKTIPHLSGYEEYPILQQNLEYLGINDYVVLSKELPWQWTDKIRLILKFLQEEKCDTELLMYCDPIDVIFRDSPQRVIDIFESFNCDLLFMSTTPGVNDGYNCMPDVKLWADSDPERRGRYINAGVFIGKTTFIKEFLEDSLNYCTDNDCMTHNWQEYLKSKPVNFPVGGADQDIFRFLEPKYYPRVKVDYRNIMAYRG